MQHFAPLFATFADATSEAAFAGQAGTQDGAAQRAVPECRRIAASMTSNSSYERKTDMFGKS
jgi:hypothetical protein